MQPLKRRGIVLITTLLMTVLVVMIVTVVVYTGASSLALSGNFYEREAALLAADSGVQYAMARLQADPGWRGDSPGTVPAGTPDFAVMEKQGNVFGFLSTTYGHKSQFRIKFNYEDDAVAGSPGADGLVNTSRAEDVLPTSLVSINNLLGTSSVPAKRANEDGIGYSAATPAYDVPRATACILVEGLAGWGLRDADSGNPHATLSNRSVTRRVVEAYLGIDYTAGVDSAAYAAGTLDARLANGGTFRVSSSDDDMSPKVRSLQDVTMASQTSGGSVNYEDGTDGEVVVGQGRNFRVNGTTPTSSTVTQANSSDLFKRISWSSIRKASPTTDARLPAGTYVWRLGEANQPFLEYFPVEYADYVRDPSAVSAVPATLPAGVTVDTDTMSVILSKNVYVSSSGADGAPTGLAILTDPALTAAGMRPNLGFQPPGTGQQSSVLTSAGSVRVEGAVLGSGAVTSEGSITFQGPSILESDPETGVSLYAKGDINVQAIPPPRKTKIGRGDKSSGGGDQPTDGSTPGIVVGDPSTGGALDDGTETTYFITTGTKAQSAATTFKNKLPPGLVKDSTVWVAKKAAQLEAFSDAFGRVDYSDQSLTGVIYTWGNFNARLGNNNVLSMTGTLIAYGGDPESATNSAPGTALNSGKIDLEAGNVDLTYDPTYLKDLLANTGSIRVKRNLWATW